jgi:outer membrane lipoprotein-sorting protein
MPFLLPHRSLGQPDAQRGFGAEEAQRWLGRGRLGLRKTNPLLRLAILGLGLCLMGLSGCGGGAAARKASLDELLRDVETKSYLVQQFRAQFEKTRRSDVFDRELSVKGNLIFQKPNKFHLSVSGDVNVEILSDGETITIVHDGRDQETYHVQGERDLSRFADPLMVLLQSIGNGGLRKFAVARQGVRDHSVLLEAEPNGQLYFERTKKVLLKLSDSGEIRSVRLLYSDGDHDETVFHSWAMLARNDPEIIKLNSRLKTLSRRRSPHSSETASGPTVPCPLSKASHQPGLDDRNGEAKLLCMVNPRPFPPLEILNDHAARTTAPAECSVASTCCSP